MYTIKQMSSQMKYGKLLNHGITSRKIPWVNQLVRSADSISANIAEGYGRYFFKENRNFCYYSRGSLLETKNWIGKAYRRQIIDQENHDNLVKELDQLHKSLNGYIKYITESSRKES